MFDTSGTVPVSLLAAALNDSSCVSEKQVKAQV